jgi:hypothetical protein
MILASPRHRSGGRRPEQRACLELRTAERCAISRPWTWRLVVALLLPRAFVERSATETRPATQGRALG